VLRLYHADGRVVDAGDTVPGRAQLAECAWIDLSTPAPEQIAAVEDVFGIDLPDTAEMGEIEASSRVYRDGDASYMTALLVAGFERSDVPIETPVTFVLTKGGQLVTIRYSDPLAFRTAAGESGRRPPNAGGLTLLLYLLDLIVDRTADILEHLNAGIDRISHRIFGRDEARPDRRLSPGALQEILRQIGHVQFTVNKVHASLQTLSRIIIFLNVTGTGNVVAADRKTIPRGDRDALKSLGRDISGLTENAIYVMQNVFFLLDAAVGRISIEQNIIIKLLSVASVTLLPPTLIAGIYGMNFAHMPELAQPWGYPLALLLMLMAAILPLFWLRRKGWL